jgi:DNA-binding beta-propeller fold protein YncE
VIFKKLHLSIRVGLFLGVMSCLMLPSVAQAQYTASDVIGQLDGSNDPVFTTSYQNGRPSRNEYGLTNPNGMVVDTVGHRLFVADTGEGRVLVWNLDSSNTIDFTQPADNVIGQADMYTRTISCAANRLNSPTGLAFDPNNQFLYVADNTLSSSGRNRVLVFDVSGGVVDGMSATYAIGQTNTSTCAANTTRSASALQRPYGLAFDPDNRRLFVSSTVDHRVLVFDVSAISSSGISAAHKYGQTTFSAVTSGLTNAKFNTPKGLAFEPNEGILYVADSTNNRVITIDTDGAANNATLTSVTTHTHVLGQMLYTTNATGTTATAMDEPLAVAVDDASNRLYVADSNNYRITSYDVGSISDGMSADRVLGQTDFTSLVYADSDKRFFAQDVALLGTGVLAVADSYRLLKFDVSTLTNDESSIQILGQTDIDGNIWTDTDYSQSRIPTAETLMTPHNVAIDETNKRAFVADYGNNRVLVYNLDSNGFFSDPIADYVLGVPNTNGINDATDFHLRGTAALSASTFSPFSIAYYPDNNWLLVADDASARILVFDVSSITNGEDAVKVIGQADLVTNTSATSADRIGYDNRMFVDSVNDRLFVSDFDNYRVLVFDLSGTVPNGGLAASYVLGQPNFDTANVPVGPEANTFYDGPEGIAYDSVHGLLFVSEESSPRVMVFDISGGISNNMNATKVLGQPNLTTEGASASPSNSNVRWPEDMIVDATNNSLYVLDCYFDRVLRFDISDIVDAEPAVAIIGAADYVTFGGTSATTSSVYCDESGLGISNTNHQLYVGQYHLNRVSIFNLVRLPSTLPDGTVNTSYAQSVAASSTQGTVSYTVVSGSLPAGLSLVGNQITGTPTTAGVSTFSLKATDDNGSIGTFTDTHSLTLTISAGGTPTPSPTATPTPTPAAVTSNSSNSSPGVAGTGACTAFSPKGSVDLFQIDVQANSALLSFAPTGESDGYAIYYGRANGPEEYGTSFDLKSSGAVQYRINDLRPNTSYWFEVAGYRSCAFGGRSNRMSITTPGRGSVSFYKNGFKLTSRRVADGSVRGASVATSVQSDIEPSPAAPPIITQAPSPISSSAPVPAPQNEGGWWQSVADVFKKLF